MFNIFKKWKAQVEKQTGKKIKYLRTNNGLEYRDKEFIRFCELKGITRHFTVKGTPQQNRVAERMNRTLEEIAKCMRLNTALLKVFQPKTINTTSFIINRSPSSAIDFKILEEVWSSRPIYYSSLKFFGCPSYMHVQSGEPFKLDSKSRKCIFLALEKCVKGYWLWDPISKKMVTNKYIIFDEAFLLKHNEAEICNDNSQKKLTVEVEFDENSSPSDKGDNNDIDPQQKKEELYLIVKGKEKLVHKASQRYGYEYIVSFALITNNGDPSSYRYVEEMGSLQKNKTQESVKLSKGKKTNGCKWVYNKKEALSENECEKFKARLVTMDCSQKVEENALDMLTKPVPTNKFKNYLDLVGVYSL